MIIMTIIIIKSNSMKQYNILHTAYSLFFSYSINKSIKISNQIKKIVCNLLRC